MRLVETAATNSIIPITNIIITINMRINGDYCLIHRIRSRHRRMTILAFGQA